jgi:16S rRNA G966 N2-methylase RsmD
MARKTTTAQPSFFHRDIPVMPDGYYSSGPNPNLRRFVEEHATPYDPATDDYDVPPFDQPITTTKATAIYNMHTYWSKKPHDAIRRYISHYTQPGDLVLDPFCGSGGTALAALMEGRAAIAIDLSPAATFITKNYCTPVDVDELQREFEALQAAVKPEMDWLYETRCDRCDGRATTSYTVYSYIFRCPRCLEKVSLFDCVEIEGQTADGKPKKVRVCPYCYARGHEEEISTRAERFDPMPVLVSYECGEGCKPKRGERHHNDPDPKKRAFFEEYDLGKLREIEAQPIPHWVPPHRMMNVESDTERWGDKWRAGTSSFRTVAGLFTKRNLWALAALLDATKKTGSDSFLFAFQGNILTASRLQQFHEGGGGFTRGTYYIPQLSTEREQWACFARKVADVVEGIRAVAEGVHQPRLCISTQSATDLSALRASSVDYVFTDPPYADKVQYGELNFVWEAWLGFDTHWHDQEIIVNETRGMTEADWARLMRQAMSECYRVLKPGHWISLCYHDTSEGTWQLVQDIMAEAGFISEISESTLFIDTREKSYNQRMADKVTKRDLVINFRKPRLGEVAPALVITGDEDATTFAEKARAILVDALERHPGASGDRLYDELVSRMVRRGEFERHNFEALLAQVAEPVREAVMRNLLDPTPPDLFGGHEVVRWYLKDSADHLDEAESRKEAAAAARLDKFMAAALTPGPSPKPGRGEMSEGVHYSDLFEQYLPIADKPRRLLADWLPEYFIKTLDGTWRPPADDEERALLAALRTTGSLRHIKRFAAALLEGVPPAERDRPANVVDAADWLRQCRRAGLYELGRAIYEKGAFRFDELGEEQALEVEEDYQVCVRRSG